MEKEALKSGRFAYKELRPAQVDLSQIESEKLEFNFFGNSLLLERNYIETVGEDQINWSGAQGLSSAAISVVGSNLYGVIVHSFEKYILEGKNGKYSISKLDQSKFPPESCALEKRSDELTPAVHFDSYPEREEIAFKVDNSASSPLDPPVFSCILRTLVVYNGATEAHSNNNMDAYLANMAFTLNQSFVFSAINAWVDIVHAEKVQYLSGGYDLDVARLRNPNDGHLDIVHSLRSKHQADVVVLLITNMDLCGKASNTKVCADNAFAVVNATCAISQSTFGHEIGHLLGAHHDGVIDYYPWAQGFRHEDDLFRTIMGTNVQGVPRLNYWSNPNVTIGGLLSNGDPWSSPTGVSGVSNVAFLWNNYFQNIMSFREDGVTRQVVQADMVWLFPSIQLPLIYNQDKIETVGSVWVPLSEPWTIVSGKDIYLNPGFEVHQGAEFRAYNDETVCGVPDNETCRAAPNKFGNFNIGVDISDSRELFPNPNHQRIFSLNLESYEGNRIDLMLYDGYGKRVLKKSIDRREKSLILPQGLNAGTYYLKIFSDSKLKGLEKIILL